MFVESYGQMAVQGTSFSPGIDEVVNAGTQQLAGRRVLIPQRLAHLVDVRRRQLARARHAAVGSLGQQPQALFRADREPTSHARQCAFRRAGWSTVADVPATHGSWPEGQLLLPLREDLGPRQPRVPRPEIRLLADAGPVRAPGSAEARAGEAEPCALSSPRSTSPRATSPGRASHRSSPGSGSANGSIFKRLPIDRTGLTDTQAGIREVDSVRPACAVLVRRALRQREHRADRAGRPPAVEGDRAANHEVPITIIAHDPER